MKRKKLSDSYNVKLDPYEQEIEDSLDFKKVKRVKNFKALMAALKVAAINYRKNKQSQAT